MDSVIVFFTTLSFWKGKQKWVNLEDVQARFRFIKRQGKVTS